MGLKKIALVPGHTLTAPGAFSQALGKTERDWALDLCQSLCSVLCGSFDAKIYLRDNHTIEETYAMIADWGPDLSIETHFNSEGSTLARGTETICALKYQQFGVLIQNSMVLALDRVGNSDRGTLLIHPGDQETRGWASVQASWPQALIEPFFGSNSEDSHLFEDRRQDVCSGLYRACQEWFDQVDPGWDSPDMAQDK